MPSFELPVLLSPERLADLSGLVNLKIIYVGKHENFSNGHIPGALQIPQSALSLGVKPVVGYLPPRPELQTLFRNLGVNDSDHVVCYDDDGGVAAARLFWVLEVMGHSGVSYLDGGLLAWNALSLPVESGETARPAKPGNWTPAHKPALLATKQEVLEAIESDHSQILDARSPEEHNGLKSASARRGHIPGAIHLNWLDTRDTVNNNRLKSPEELREMLARRGIDQGNTIIPHCQTHHRSSHSYMMLRSLGFHNVAGYAGSWSEWAADTSLPIVMAD